MSNPLIQHPNVPWVHCADAGPNTRLRFFCMCRVCGAEMPSYGTPQQADAFAAAHAAHQSASPTHFGLGDLVAKATGTLGIKPCTPCEARRRAMNNAFPQVLRRR
jgi:hypothetical protein